MSHGFDEPPDEWDDCVADEEADALASWGMGVDPSQGFLEEDDEFLPPEEMLGMFLPEAEDIVSESTAPSPELPVEMTPVRRIAPSAFVATPSPVVTAESKRKTYGGRQPWSRHQLSRLPLHLF